MFQSWGHKKGERRCKKSCILESISSSVSGKQIYFQDISNSRRVKLRFNIS